MYGMLDLLYPESIKQLNELMFLLRLYPFTKHFHILAGYGELSVN